MIKINTISTIPDEIIAPNTPIKKIPVLVIKNDIANKQNKPIKIAHNNNEKHKAKNLITPTTNLDKPLINLYSLCFGSLIIILFSFFFK